MNKATKPRNRTKGVAPKGGSRVSDVSGEVGFAGDDLDLPVALRERLLERMRDARVPEEGHAQALYLASITGRRYQTTRRWIDAAAPGLPDLASFKLLCAGMDGDPSWLLGLVDEKRSLREAAREPRPGTPQDVGRGDWMQDVTRDVRQHMFGCQTRRMHGDEMEPEIGDGDTVFIDSEVLEFRGNGNYLIACEGLELIRRLEFHVGRGLVLACANPRYEPLVIKDAAESLRRQVRVLGRVEGVIQIRKFWRGSIPGRSGAA